ncbi:MAG: PAS domain S-box protein, partial [Proteobacteria bacterium]|nr:PAS domain S-box protein [Pseudomonadota bacterium]
SLIVNDPALHPDRIGVPEGHPPVNSFLGVPLKSLDKMIGMIGLGNKESGYDLGDQEAVEALSVVFTEALNRKRRELAISESEEKYRSLVEFTEDHIYLIDKSIRYVFANKKYQSRFDLPMDKIIGNKYGEFHSQDETKDFIAKVHKVFETGQSLSYEHQSDRDGKYFIRTLSPVKEPGGRTTYVTVISKEITDHKQAEKALELSGEKLLKECNQRKVLSKRLIDLLEKDRHEIAMELHDHIGQILTSLKIDIEVIEGLLKPTDAELRFQIKAAKGKAISAIKDIKNISHGLKPGILDTLGLVSSLEELFSEIQENTDIRIEFFYQNVPKRFDPENELAIYRIAQEALNNIVKHARAKNVFVNLVKKGEVLSLSVEDDGIGFDQGEAIKISKWQEAALGLIIMQERAIQRNGTLAIESQIGKGSHVLAEIPL